MTPTKKLAAAIFVVVHTDSTYLAIPDPTQKNNICIREKLDNIKISMFTWTQLFIINKHSHSQPLLTIFNPITTWKCALAAMALWSRVCVPRTVSRTKSQNQVVVDDSVWSCPMLPKSFPSYNIFISPDYSSILTIEVNLNRNERWPADFRSDNMSESMKKRETWH